MYFEDLTPYTYTSMRLPDDAPSLVNCGWLDGEHDYVHGYVSPELIERLLRLAARYEVRTRGFHCCPFCKDCNVSMPLGDEDVHLGSAEIRITSGATTYVAPNLLPHYIEKHQYMPPQEVLRAIGTVSV